MPVDGRHERAAEVGRGLYDDGRDDGDGLDGSESQVNGVIGESQVNDLDVTPEQLGRVRSGDCRGVCGLDAGDGCDQLGRRLSVGADGR